MTWHDASEIGEALFEQFDTLNPLSVRSGSPDLHKHVPESSKASPESRMNRTKSFWKPSRWRGTRSGRTSTAMASDRYFFAADGTRL